jgi:hypothetical protein
LGWLMYGEILQFLDLGDAGDQGDPRRRSWEADDLSESENRLTHFEKIVGHQLLRRFSDFSFFLDHEP